MTGKEKIRVAAVQIAPDLDTPTGTLDRVLAATAEAAAKGARLVVFPETRSEERRVGKECLE